jgi:hypothetical protein
MREPGEPSLGLVRKKVYHCYGLWEPGGLLAHAIHGL